MTLYRGIPTEETAAAIYNHLDYIRGVESLHPSASKRASLLYLGKVAVNDDGSVDLYFGPEAPAGKEANWLQTVTGKGWFCVLRLYSPTEAWFDKTWRPGEIELVK